MLLWALWFSRNNGLFNNRWLTPGEVMDLAGRTYEAYQSCWRESDSEKAVVPVNRWSKWRAPLGSDLKLNVDAAVIPDQNAIGVGVVIRDSEGIVRACFARRIQGCFEVMTTEAIALREGLEFDVSMGLTISIVEQIVSP